MKSWERSPLRAGRLGRSGCHGESVRIQVHISELLLNHAVDAVCILVPLVKAQFIPHIEKDENEGRHPDGQARNVEKGIDLVLFYVAEGDDEIVLKHRPILICCFKYRLLYL